MNNKIVFANLFNKYPLFDYITNDKIEVTIVSHDGDYKDYLSSILQTGQLLKKPLEITIFTNKPHEEKEQYLLSWPALCDFFEIDGRGLSGNVDSYGKIRFKRIENINDADEILSCISHTIKYTFVTCGKDSSFFAEVVNEHNKLFKEPFVVFFIDENNFVYTITENGTAKYNYNYVDERLSIIAFNSHLIWLSRIKGKNLQQAYDEFINSSDYPSSYALAVSVVYKLRYLDFDFRDIESRVEELEQRINSDSNVVAELSYLEHKRWAVNMIVNGWSAPKGEGLEKYSYALDMNHFVVDHFRGHILSSKKIHSCVVHSTPSIGITDSFDWEKGQIDKLDDLDKMSIELHRAYVRNSTNYWKNHDIESEPAYMQLLSYIDMTAHENIDEARFELEKYRSAIYGVLNNDPSQCKAFSDIETKFLNFAKKYSEKLSKKIESCVIELRTKLLAKIKAYSYEDFKKKDFSIIYALPFIVTYDFRNAFGAPLLVSSLRENAFDNVAAILCLKPTKVSYIVDVYEKEIDKTAFIIERSLICVKANTNSQITLFVLCSGNNSKIKSILNKFKDNKLLDDFIIENNCDEQKKAELAVKYLKEQKINYYNCTKHTFDDEETNLLFASELFKNFNTFTYDYKSQKFIKIKVLNGRNNLKYMSLASCFSNEYLSMADLMALFNAKPSIKTNTFISKKEIDILWDNFIFEKGENGMKRYNEFCQFVQLVGQKNMLNKNSILLPPTIKSQYQDYLRVFDDFSIASVIKKLGVEYLQFNNPSTLSIFTKIGDLFERHCYYECINSTLFDEIVSGTAIDYADSSMHNEVDLILVKGFNVVILECKTADRPDDNMLKKIYYVSLLFGTNSKAAFACTKELGSNSTKFAVAAYLDMLIVDNCANRNDFAKQIIKQMN